MTRNAFLFAALLAALSTRAIAAEPSFENSVAPVLARRCLGCHNSSDLKGGLDLSREETARKGGENGVAFTPNKPDDSPLWQYVESNEMPPKKPLADDEKAILREWIASGAKWSGGAIDVFKYSSDARAGYDWWSLKPVQRPAAPAVKQADWPRGDLDRFILHALEAKGLTPTAEADRATLVRRVTFDLTGLPPTPEETAAFLADESPDAYDKLVDRLLASPGYGEHWARKWLDVVRFAESQGFERDRLRDTAWPYRDWVIESLNDDMPYDEFVRRQIAGDVLRPNDPTGVVAAGFWTAGAYDEVGQTQQSEAMRRVVRQDELEDLTGVAAQTFLGLTANCARCHDHKFDPIRQQDYYALAAAISGVRHGERERASGALSDEAQAVRTRLDQEIALATAAVEAFDAPVRATILASRDAARRAVAVPAPVAAWEFNDDANDAIGDLDLTLHNGAKLESGRLVLDGDDDWAESVPLVARLEGKTFECWVAPANLDQRGGGVMNVQTADGAIFDALVFGEREPKRWVPGSNSFHRTQDVAGTDETAANELVHMAITYRPDGQIQVYRNGRPYGRAYSIPTQQPFEAGVGRVAFGVRHGSATRGRMFAGSIDRARLYDRALTPEEVGASAGLVIDAPIAESEIVARLTREQRVARDVHWRTLSDLKSRRALLAAGKTYTITPQQPETTKLLHRGDTRHPRDAVAPAGIASVGQADFALAPDAPEGERRRRLAEWIVGPQNPLAARVLVNRIWLGHFGAGLVDTPNDFGFQGGRPSHPELLDWLASEFVSGGWKLKRLHRLIALSATYRQGAAPNEAAQAIDADNRLLWRRRPERLSAEGLRDAVLAVSGRMNPTMGGPGFRDFRTFTHNSQFYEMLDPVGREFERRTIYRTLVRSGRSTFLDAFDCPDPATTTPKRAVTTTPLQALSLLNNSFMLRMAENFAARLADEAGDDAPARIERAYLLAFARPPKPSETTLGAAYAAKHGWPAYCRVLLNTNEFVYVD